MRLTQNNFKTVKGDLVLNIVL